MRFVLIFSAVLWLTLNSVGHAQSVVTGGQTSILLDTNALSNAGLDVVGYTPGVIVPGDLGPDSAAFEITGDTTFEYEPSTLAPFNGEIQHFGGVLFAQQFLLGSFSIEFDPNRVTARNSGFFVRSNADVFVIVFDIENPSLVDAQPNSLTIRSNLLVAPEFAAFWFNSTNLIGLDVGDALITATANSRVAPDSFMVTRGNLAAGGIEELLESDNQDLCLRRSSNDIQSRTELTIESTSPTTTPTSFKFTLEASVFARSNVVQSIELFDYVADDWELIGAVNASRSPAPDSVFTAEPTGDLTRFVQAGTNRIEARLRFQSDNSRQQFASCIDQAIWTIGEGDE